MAMYDADGNIIPEGYTVEQWGALSEEERQGALAAAQSGRVSADSSAGGGAYSGTMNLGVGASAPPVMESAPSDSAITGYGGQPVGLLGSGAEVPDGGSIIGSLTSPTGLDASDDPDVVYNPNHDYDPNVSGRQDPKESMYGFEVDDDDWFDFNESGKTGPSPGYVPPGKPPITTPDGVVYNNGGGGGGGDGDDTTVGGFDITDPLGYKAAAREEWEHEQARLAEQKDLATGAKDYAEDKTTGIMDIIGAGGDARTDAVETGTDSAISRLAGGAAQSVDALEIGYGDAKGDIAGGLDTATGQVTTGYGSGKDRLAGDVGTSRIDSLLKGDLSRENAYAGFEADPGYQFAIDEATNAVSRRQAARGGRNAPAADSELARVIGGIASQQYGQWANRRQGDNQMAGGFSQSADATDLSKAGTLSNLDVGEGTALAGLTTDAAGQTAGFDAQSGRDIANTYTGAAGQMAGYEAAEGGALSGIIGDTTGMQVDAQGNLINVNTGLTNTTIGNVGGAKGPGMAAAGSATNQSILDAIIGIWGGA